MCRFHYLCTAPNPNGNPGRNRTLADSFGGCRSTTKLQGHGGSGRNRTDMRWVAATYLTARTQTHLWVSPEFPYRFYQRPRAFTLAGTHRSGVEESNLQCRMAAVLQTACSPPATPDGAKPQDRTGSYRFSDGLHDHMLQGVVDGTSGQLAKSRFAIPNRRLFFAPPHGRGWITPGRWSVEESNPQHLRAKQRLSRLTNAPWGIRWGSNPRSAVHSRLPYH